MTATAALGFFHGNEKGGSGRARVVELKVGGVGAGDGGLPDALPGGKDLVGRGARNRYLRVARGWDLLEDQMGRRKGARKDFAAENKGVGLRLVQVIVSIDGVDRGRFLVRDLRKDLFGVKTVPVGRDFDGRARVVGA